MKPTPTFKYDVFLSHNSKDKDSVRAIAQKLHESGLNVWFDEWLIKPGDDIYLKIEKGLAESKTLILCLSSNALNSDWVALERSTVLFRDPTNSGRRFIPLLIQDCDLPDTLKRYRYIDYRNAMAASFNELLAACGRGNQGEDILWLNNKLEDLALPKEIEEQIELAKQASQNGRYDFAKEIWNKIAEVAPNQKLLIRVRLELAQIEVTEDSYDLDKALEIANECLNESKKVNLGNQVGRILQILGEIHRLKGNIDQARGFLNAAFEFSISRKDKNFEGWALLALGMLSNQNQEPFNIQFGFTQKAYDAFTSLFVSDEKGASEKANSGFAMCHLLRAQFHSYERYEEALAEYSRAIAIYRQMGKSWEYNLGKALLQRGEKQIMKDLEQGLQDIVNAENIFNELDDQFMAAKYVMACAELLDSLGHRKEAEKYYRSALQKVFTIKNEKKKSWFFFRYAMKLLELEEHDTAKEILIMLLSSEITTDSQKLDVLKTLSDLAKVTQNETELKEYELKSLLIIENLISEAQSPKERLRLLFKKGDTLHQLNKYELALDTFNRAMRLAESISDKNKQIDIWSSIAEVQHKLKDPKEERRAYEAVLKLFEDDESSPQLITTLAMVAQMELKESNLDEAKLMLDKAEVLCKKLMPFMMFVIKDIRQRINEAELKKSGQKND